MFRNILVFLYEGKAHKIIICFVTYAFQDPPLNKSTINSSKAGLNLNRKISMTKVIKFYEAASFRLKKIKKK